MRKILLSFFALLLCSLSAWATDYKQGKLPGAFSISSTKVVYFAQGNLQYTGSWRFADNQWDILGNTQADNHRDLFRWGSGTTPNMTCSEYVAEFNEWGANAITNGGNTANMWRTLSNDEWKYLLVGRANQENLTAVGTVESVEGLILLPDDWTLPSGASLNVSGAGYSSNVYNSAQWVVLEAAGAVFLPVAGQLYNGDYSRELDVVCYYWMSSGDPNSNDVLGFHPAIEFSDMQFAHFCRYVGANMSVDARYSEPVRLVSETPAPTASITSAPTAKTGLVYTGAAQALINAGTAEGGTMYYSLNNSTWSTDIPTGSDAGNYTVYYKVIGDANHFDFTPASNTVAVTINVASITTSSSVTTNYTTLADALAAWENNSTLILLADVTMSSRVEVSNTRTIDLNGYGIRMTGYDCFFLVQEGGDLTMIDSNPTRSTRTYNVSDHLATLADGGAYSFQGGYLTGGYGSRYVEDEYYRGGAVLLRGANCRFTMRGGTILGNSACFGGGVHVRRGRFVMEGGAIIYNKATSCMYHGGGAIFVDCGYGADLTIGGTALIEHNYSNGYDNGQVYIGGCSDGQLVISGGSPRVINSASTNNLIIGTCIMTITGALTADANLSLYVYQPGVITSGYGTYNGNTDPNTFFSVQNSGYTLRLNADGEVHAVIPASVTSAPTAISGLEYTGKAQTLITAGSATGGEMQYKLNDGGWGTSLPQATGVGDYTVYYKVVGDANHIDVAEASIAVSIAAPSAVVLTANQDPQHTTDYYSTFYHSAIAYELSAGAEAYVATLSGDALNLTKIAEGGQVIPSDNAVILKANSSSISLTPSDGTPESFEATNNLRGTDEAMSAPANCYVLSGHSTDEDGDGYYDVTGVGFYQYTGTLKAHRAYVVVADKVSAPKKLRFAYDQTTDIDNVQNDNVQCTKVLRDNQVIIIRNGVEYTVSGQIIK